MPMKRIWILILAAMLSIPVIPAMSTAGIQQHEGGFQIGRFNYTNGFANGEFVNFQINDKTGEIENYKVNGTMVFQSVTYENETSGSVWTKGATLFYYGMGEKINFNYSMSKMNFMWRFIHAHDNPAGVFHIVVYGEDTVTYTLATGIQAVQTNKHIITLNGTITGVLIFTGNAVINGNKISVTMGAKNYTFGNYEFRGGSAIFIKTGGWNLPSKIREKIINAIQQGKMGGEIDINGKNSDFINYTYGLHANVKSSEKNNVQISVSSENSEGKVIMINVDKSTLNYDSNHEITVKIDGKVIKEESEDSVMAGGSEGKYAVVNGENTVTILIYVPHFSSHSVDIQSQEKTPVIGDLAGNPLMLGVIVLVIIVIIAGIVVVIKRR